MDPKRRARAIALRTDPLPVTLEQVDDTHCGVECLICRLRDAVEENSSQASRAHARAAPESAGSSRRNAVHEFCRRRRSEQGIAGARATDPVLRQPQRAGTLRIASASLKKPRMHLANERCIDIVRDFSNIVGGLPGLGPTELLRFERKGRPPFSHTEAESAREARSAATAAGRRPVRLLPTDRSFDVAAQPAVVREFRHGSHMRPRCHLSKKPLSQVSLKPSSACLNKHDHPWSSSLSQYRKSRQLSCR